MESSKSLRQLLKGTRFWNRAGATLAIVALAVSAFMVTTFRAVMADGSDSTKIEAQLSGAMLNGLIPKGEAELESFTDGSRKFEIEVENVNLPDGTVLNVVVDGTKVGTLTLALHRATLELKREDGATLPQINSRTRIVITDSTGNTILAGAFSNIPPSPSPTGSPTPSSTVNPNAAVRLEARLAGGAISGLTPKGKAKFLTRPDGRRKLNVEIEKVNVTPGTVLNVLLDNVKVGEIVIGQGLEGELELDTQKGNTVPKVNASSTIVIGNLQNATMLSGVFNTVRNDVQGNDIDNDEMFVEQQYNDFLDREGDDSGLDFWEQQIKNCGANAACREVARINTSGAFFLSIEFRDTGYLLYRFNKESFGAMPRRNDFMVEMQSIAQGVIVNSPGWEQKLEDNKRREAERFVQRQDFRNRFDDKSNRDFVNLLFSNAGITPDPTERENLIKGLDARTETRATVLRKVAENIEFSRKEQNPAFVLMQYFGYLHRNPDEGVDHDLSGFNFWLGKLNEHQGNFVEAEMVKAFLNSTEYRQRFDW